MRFSCGSPAVDGCTPSTKFDMTITKIVRKFNKHNEAEKWGLVMDNLSLQDRIATGLCHCKDGDNCDTCGLHLTILPRNEYEDRKYQYYISEPPDVPSWKKGAPYRGYAGQHPETKDLVEWRTVLSRLSSTKSTPGASPTKPSRRSLGWRTRRAAWTRMDSSSLLLFEAQPHRERVPRLLLETIALPPVFLPHLRRLRIPHVPKSNFCLFSEMRG